MHFVRQARDPASPQYARIGNASIAVEVQLHRGMLRAEVNGAAARQFNRFRQTPVARPKIIAEI
jgi:hypothetical protein